MSFILIANFISPFFIFISSFFILILNKLGSIMSYDDSFPIN